MKDENGRRLSVATTTLPLEGAPNPVGSLLCIDTAAWSMALAGTFSALPAVVLRMWPVALFSKVTSGHLWPRCLKGAAVVLVESKAVA